MPVEPERQPSTPRPFHPATPVVIGILGGVASGKSTVARLFAAHGLRHLDADAKARVLTEEPTVLADLAARWPQVVARSAAPPRLDRAALAQVVFSDPCARKELEALLHPRIRSALLAELAAARAAGESVLLDVPLLLENGLIAECDHVVFVHADAASRARRAAERGWGADELARREAAQAPLAEKATHAGHRIDNSGDLDATRAQVAALLDALAGSP